MDFKNKIIITGHPYAFPYYFKVFEYVNNNDELAFVLPKLWVAKQGKVRVNLEQKPRFNIYGLRTASYGGRGLGGLLKGWLPGIIFLLPYLKLKYRSKVFYSCSEPNLLTTLFNGIMAKPCGMKYVFFTWQNVAPEKYMSGLKLKVYRTLVGLNLKLVDGVICGNRKAQKIVSSFQFPVSRTIVCPLAGVDIEKFKPGITSNWREKLGIKPEEKLILFYGVLDKRKGLDVLIKAFDKICKLKIVNCKLIIVGAGPEEKNLELQVESLKLQDKVKFLDWLPNDQLPTLLNATDVFVYPSVPSGGWEEQFGYAMAEASACGVPVVATKTGSIDEVVRDNESGILVEPKDLNQLAEAIARILSDKEFAERTGKYGRKYVLDNFSHGVVADKLTNFLINI